MKFKWPITIAIMPVWLFSRFADSTDYSYTSCIASYLFHLLNDQVSAEIEGSRDKHTFYDGACDRTDNFILRSEKSG